MIDTFQIAGGFRRDRSRYQYTAADTIHVKNPTAQPFFMKEEIVPLAKREGLPEVKTFTIPDSLFRIGSIAAIAAGILMIGGFVLHPAGEEATYGTDPFWIPAHALTWAAYAISLVAWIAVYLVQAREAGGVGVAALVIVIVGTSFASWIFSSDVTFVPVLARLAPALFDRIYAGPALVLGIASVLTWVLGNVLFGASILRAKVFSRWPGILLIVGTAVIPIAYLAHLPEKVIAIGGSLAGVSLIWLGSELPSRATR